jgi:hypothetical protein
VIYALGCPGKKISSAGIVTSRLTNLILTNASKLRIISQAEYVGIILELLTGMGPDQLVVKNLDVLPK